MKKVAIMMSGGLDSFISYYYAKTMGYEPIAIWVNLGQPYAQKETRALNSFKFSVIKITCDILREEFNNLPTIDDQIIQGRNGLLAEIGSMFADRVWICALDGEQHQFMPDKNSTFFSLASGYLSYISNKKIIVETPFEKMSKTDIIKWAIENNITVEDLRKTSSCYDGKTKLPCGICSTCFKRWVAFRNNNLYEDYGKPPYQSKYAIGMIAKMKKKLKNKDFSHYSEKRIKEVLLAISGL